MKAFNDWCINNLGDFCALFVILTAVLSVLLVIMIIALAVSGKRNKKKSEALKEELVSVKNSAASGDEDRKNAETEYETARKNDEEKLATAKAENDKLRAENEKLNAELTKKQHAIDELTSSIARAKNAKKDASDDDDDEYYNDFGDETSDIKVTVKFDRPKNSWIVCRSDSEKVHRRVSTKQEALFLGKDLANKLHAQLVVHKKDGKFQKV